MRCLIVCLLALASCSSETKADLAKPVTAPMTARERLLHDLREQKAKAREREDAFEQAVAPR